MPERVTESDRRRFERQADALRSVETDDPGSVADRARVREMIRRRRVARGQDPFVDPEEDPPELEFFRRAEARGMVAARDWGP